MEFTLYNHILSFDHDYLTGAEIYHTVHDAANECASQLMVIYSQIKTLNDLAEFSQKSKPYVYKKTYDFIFAFLSSKFQSFSAQDNETPYLESNAPCQFEITLSRILNKYFENNDENSIEKIYKTLRTALHQSPGKDIVPSADQTQLSILMQSHLKNLSMAEVNLLLNSLDSPHSTMDITPQMRALMNERVHSEALRKSIYKDISSVLLPVLETLKTHYGFEIKYTDSDYMAAQEIMTKLENHLYNDFTLRNMIHQLIYLSPYDPKCYLLPFYILGDKDAELKKISECLGVDIDFNLLEAGVDNARVYLGDSFHIIEKKLCNNFFYKQTRSFLGKPLALLLHEAKSLFSDEIQTMILSSLDYDNGIFNEIITSYGCYEPPEETPLLIFHWDGAKTEDGFILTDKWIYVFSGVILGWNDIRLLQFTEKGLLIQGCPMESSKFRFPNGMAEEFDDFAQYLSMLQLFYNPEKNPCVDDSPLDWDSPLSTLRRLDYEMYGNSIARIFYDEGLSECVIAYSDDPSIRRKFSNAIEAYAPLTEEEIPILCFDNTAFGSCKDGLLATNQALYIHNGLSRTQKFSYADIQFILVRATPNPELVVNDFIVQTAMLTSELAKRRFALILNRIRKDFLLLKPCKLADPYQLEKASTLSELIHTAEELATSNPVAEKKIYILSSKPRTTQKLSNAVVSYGRLEEGEAAYLCFDDTVFGSAKEGCIATNIAIHIHNAFSPAKKIPYSEISNIALSGSNNRDLFINDIELFTSTLNTYESKVILCRILNLFHQYFHPSSSDHRTPY